MLERTDDHSFLPYYVGTGGDQPGVYLISEQREPERVVAMEPGQSIYALSQSPDGTKLIAGTRDRYRNDELGRVSIWERSLDGSLSNTPLLSCFQPSSVTGVAMATSTVGVSGGLDGMLRFWDIEEPHKPVAEVQSHQGPVLALSCLSSQIAFTIGADGIGKIWDLDRIEVVQAFSDPGAASIRGLLAVKPAPDSGQVVGLYPSGTVLIHDLRDEDVQTTPLSVFKGGISNGGTTAVTLVGQRVMIADRHSRQLRIVALNDARADLEPQAAPCPSRVLALEALDVDHVLVVYRDGSATVWNVVESPTEECTLDLQNARCAAGPPQRFQLARGRKHRSSRRESLLEQARRKLNGRQFSDVKPHLEALAEEDMSVEALVLLAEWARRNGKPLWELQTRFSLADQLPDEPWCAAHYYTLGMLLEQLNEPVEAKRYYVKAERCQSGYRDAKNRLQALPDERPIPLDAVREEEIDDPTRYILQIEKYALFNRPWTHPITVDREEENLRTETSLSIEEVCSFLPDDAWRIVKRSFFNDGSASKPIPCLEYCDPDRSTDFIYAVTFERIAGIFHCIHRLWIPAPEYPEEETFSQIRREVHRFAKEVESHIEKIQSPSFRTRKESLSDRVRGAIDRASQDSQPLF